MDKTAQRLHDYRVFPRLTLCFYGVCLWDTIQWFQRLSEPSTQQVVLLTTIVSFSAAIFGFYTKTTSGSTK